MLRHGLLESSWCRVADLPKYYHGVHASLDAWPWSQQVTRHGGSACGKGAAEALGPGFDETRSRPSDEETGDTRQRRRRGGLAGKTPDNPSDAGSGETEGNSTVQEAGCAAMASTKNEQVLVPPLAILARP